MEDGGRAWTVVADHLGRPCFLTEFDQANKQLSTLGIDRRTGKILWRRTVAPEQIEKVHELSSPAGATPATDGERVYVYFGSYGLVAYDLNGNLKWERRLPLPENPYVLGGDFKPNQRLMAYGLADGAERWWVGGLPPSGKSTPVIGDGLLFFAAPDIILETAAERRTPDRAAQFYANNAARVMAVRPGSTGEVTQADIAWSERRGVPGVPSPLFYNGRLDSAFETCGHLHSQPRLILAAHRSPHALFRRRDIRSL